MRTPVKNAWGTKENDRESEERGKMGLEDIRERKTEFRGGRQEVGTRGDAEGPGGWGHPAAVWHRSLATSILHGLLPVFVSVCDAVINHSCQKP